MNPGTPAAPPDDVMYRTAFEAAAAPLLVSGIDGRIIACNAATLDYLRRPQPQLAGSALPDWSPAMQRDGRTSADAFAALLERLRGGTTERFEWRALRGDATPVDMDVTARPLKLARRRAVGWTLQDARSPLEDSQRRLDHVLHAIGEGVWDWDLRSGLVRINPQWRAMLGLDPDALEHPVEQFGAHVHEDDRAIVHARLQRCLAGAAPYSSEHRMRRADGGVAWVHDRGSVVERDAHGAPLRMIGSVVDISERRAAEAALRASEERFRSLFETVHNVSVQGYDSERRVIFWNAASEALYGYTREEAMGRQLEDLIIPPHMREAVIHATRRWLSAGIPIPAGELTLVHKDGSPVCVFSSHTMQVNTAGEAELYCLDIDLRERKHAEARMREALVVFNASSQGIVTTSADGIILAVNPAFCAITGYTSEEVIGRRSPMFKPGRHDAALANEMRSALEAGDTWQGEMWQRRKSGELYPQWLTINTVRDAQGKVTEYVSMFSDITERKEREEAMWRQANFDVLTGLANRSLLHDRLERALAQARRNGKKVGLMFIDLDGFKWINDTLGHHVGDELLVEVARRLHGCVRDQDTVARLGGDEFTLVIHDLANGEDMLAIGEKVVDILREPFVLAGSPHHLSGSAGITVFPDDGEDVHSLLRNADIAMYKSKQAGKNRFHFYARHMQVDALARMRLEADLRLAVDQEAFVLHYQPIVDTASGALVCAEALLRWHHPLQGVISPGDFIPVAEDCGLVVPIGSWALREAASQVRRWQAQGHAPLRVAVNVSGVQFREPGLPAIIAGVLDEFGLAPGCLLLEITESVLMDSSEAGAARMREIQAHGIGYALDDFGTGFSSLSYLKRFPVDIVKIDRSFVHDCTEQRNDARLVEAIINMAHSLGLTVTAEGVETEAQLELLRQLGCDRVQGYLLGKPVPAAEFEAFMTPAALLPAVPDARPPQPQADRVAGA